MVKFTPDKIREVNADLEEDSDSDGELCVEEEGEEDINGSDVEDESGSDVDKESDTDVSEDDCASKEDEFDSCHDHEPGDVVWALWYRKWHAAKVLSLSQVPQNLHPQLVSKKTDYVIVAFYDNQKITRIHRSKIEPLGEHVIDKQRAVKDLAAYSDALADQIYGVE